LLKRPPASLFLPGSLFEGKNHLENDREQLLLWIGTHSSDAGLPSTTQLIGI
jgi:hypothetical protein